MNNILSNIRVVEMSMWLQGPVAGAHLADMGADVIKVEPLQGEVGRGVISMKAIPMSGWNWYFDSNNRNKKSIAIDLRKKDGQKIVHEIIKKSDVFLSNISRKALTDISMDYENIRNINPNIIYSISSGYGKYGPDANKPSYDATAQARSGIMSSLGEPGQPPVYTGLGSGDVLGALFTASATALALYEREKSKKGQSLDVSLLGAQIAMATPKLQAFLATKDKLYLKQHSRKEKINPFWNTYQTEDGWIFICMENSIESWEKISKALEIDYENKERYYKEHTKELIKIIEKYLNTKKSEEWENIFKEKEVIATKICSFKELCDDIQIIKDGYIIEKYHPTLDKTVKTRGIPVKFSKTPGEIKEWAPELGQHTEEILIDLLGYSWEKIEDLKETRVIL